VLFAGQGCTASLQYACGESVINTVDVRELLTNVAQAIRKCPTITLMRAYNRAYRDFCSQSQWLTVQIPGAAAVNTPQYSLGSDPYVDIIGIKGMQGSITPGTTPQFWALGPGDPSTFDPNYQPALSQMYAYVPQAQFVLFPTPNQVFSLLVGAIITPKEGAVQVPSAPLVPYSNEIEAGAMAYLFAIPGMPWTNPAESARNTRIFQAGISNAKSEVQRKFQTGSQRARPRAFVR
jgi:hypothetical protein